MTILLAVILGAAWRRWLGSERPSWAHPGYRATQIIAGIIVLSVVQVVDGSWIFRAILDSSLAIGFMLLPISISREPFVRLTKRLPLPTTDKLPHPWKPMLQGPEPWAEVLQGMTCFGLAVLI